jgi:hypothetical protein
MREIKADLHIHTCLSPCADIDMSPRTIIRYALSAGLDMIAVTDHNSAENAEATVRASDGTGISVLCGMEVTSAEEAHILALFDRPEDAVALQEVVYSRLMPGENDTSRFGEQVIADENDEVTGFNKRLLIGATTLQAGEIIRTIHSLNGLAIASHIDREAFSIISQAGFISADMDFDALEISASKSREEAMAAFGMYSDRPWVSFSDAHRRADIGKRVTAFQVMEPTVAEIAMALSGNGGRKFKWS